MTIYDHLGELRTRIIWSFLAFLVFLIAGFFFAKPVIVYLQSDPIAKDIQMNAFHLTDPLNVYVSFAFFIGLVLAAPVVLYQLWAFISPGLYENERRVSTYVHSDFVFSLFTGISIFLFHSLSASRKLYGECRRLHSVLKGNTAFRNTSHSCLTLPFRLAFCFNFPFSLCS